MSPFDYVRDLVNPHASRWKPMLMALGVAMAGIQAVAWLQPSEGLKGILVMVVAFAWGVGACALVGYVRWMFASEVERAKRAKDVERQEAEAARRGGGK